MRNWMRMSVLGGALLPAMLTGPVSAAELNFNEKTTRALMHRCRAENPPLTSKECLKYLQGLADGYCLATNNTGPEAKACADGKYAEAKASVQAIMAIEKNKKPDG